MKMQLDNFILCQMILLVVLCECSNQEAENQQDAWDSIEEANDQDNENYINGKEDLMELQPNETGESAQEEGTDGINTDGTGDKEYVVLKREAQRHTKGKKNTILKHGLHSRREGVRHFTDKISATENNVTYEKPKTFGGSSKHLENKRYTMKDSKGHFYHSASGNIGNSVIGKSKLSQQESYTTLPSYKNMDLRNKEIKYIMLNSSRNIPKHNFEIDEKIDNAMNINVKGWPNNTSAKHGNLRNKKSKSVSSNIEKEQFLSPDRTYKKSKLISENNFQTDKEKVKNEKKDEEEYSNNLKRTNFANLFSTNHENEDSKKLNLPDPEVYNNMSLINQGFLTALQNRYLKNYLKHEKNSKKLLNSQSRTESSSDDRRDYKNVIFSVEEPNRNKNNESNLEYKDKTDGNYSSNLIYENTPNTKKHNNFRISDIEENSKLDNKHLDHRKRKSTNAKVPSKSYRHKQPYTRSTLADSDVKNVVNEKHKNKISKNVHSKIFYTKESDVENSLMDSSRVPLGMDGSFGEDTSDLNLVSDEIEQTKRNERDTLRKNHRLSKHGNDDKHTRNNVFDLTSEGEIDDDGYDSNKIQEDEQDIRSESEEEENQHQSLYESNEGGRYLQNVHSKKVTDADIREGYDLDNDFKRLHAKRAHSTESNEDESSNSDTCVEYKAEQSMSTTECTTTSSEQSRLSFTTKSNNNMKTKTTPKQANNKSQTTKKTNVLNVLNISYPEEIDEYEQFLCGKLADSFVEAVLRKVHRSRKLSKELGFNNDTEDSCDRCIETRPNKLPELDTMRDTLGKCQKFNSSSKHCAKCCSIPEPIQQFINVLLKFEKENENNVYTKIRDDSSFIFTGDYPESLSQRDTNIATNSKYFGDRDSFSKDSFEKQHLREEGHDEKSGDQVPNRNSLGNVEHSPSPEDNAQDDDTVSAREDTEDEGNHAKGDLKLKPNKSANVKDTKYEAGEQHPLQSDENLKGNDLIDIFDTQDSISPARHKIAGYKDPNAAESSDSDSFKGNRNVIKNKIKNPQITNRNEPGINDDKNIENQEYKKRHFNYFNGYPAQNDLSLHQQYRDAASGFHVASGQKEPYADFRQRHQNPFQLNSGRLHKETNVDHLPQTALSNSAKDKFNKKKNYFDYAPQTYSENNQFSQGVNKKPVHYVAGSFMNPDWDSGEYQLYPNQGEIRKEDASDMMTLSGNYKNYYSDGLRVDKREIEPYEDEVIFFEIPDIEYDLYK